jgi:hypothetical protein
LKEKGWLGEKNVFHIVPLQSRFLNNFNFWRPLPPQMLQIVDFLVFINFEWNIPCGAQSVQQKQIVIAFSKLKNVYEKLKKGK